MSKVSEHRKELATCTSFWRNVAYRDVCATMEDFFENLGEILGGIEEEEREILTIDRPVAGFTTTMLKTVKETYADGRIRDWMESVSEGEKAELLMAFLNFDRLRMDNFKERYPKAFRKWTEEEDSELLAAYNSNPGGIRWGELSKKFGRNTNAIKLRLGKLGIELGDEAGHTRYPR